MIKIKIFYAPEESTINLWLQDHTNIEVISSNLACNEYGWRYTILYKKKDEN
jgi:hypothetical protein